jgi:hypothetical protein
MARAELRCSSRCIEGDPYGHHEAPRKGGRLDYSVRTLGSTAIRYRVFTRPAGTAASTWIEMTLVWQGFHQHSSRASYPYSRP